jgi:hypothetical protein
MAINVTLPGIVECAKFIRATHGATSKTTYSPEHY